MKTWLIKGFLHGHAYQTVVSLRIVLESEVHIVCRNHLYIMLTREFYQVFVDFGLLYKHFTVRVFFECLVSLKFYIIVITESFLVPDNPFLGLVKVSVHDKLRHFPSKTCRTHNQSLPVQCKFCPVSSRFVVITFSPCLADKFHQIMVSGAVLGKHDQVIAVIRLVFFIGQFFARHIHLAADDWLEFLFVWFTGILFLDIIEKFLDSEHVAMIGQRDAPLPVGNGFVYKFRYCSLSVKKAILRVHVKVREWDIAHVVYYSKANAKITLDDYFSNSIFGKVLSCY